VESKRLLFCVTADVYFIFLSDVRLLGITFTQLLDLFTIYDGDRETVLLSLSLRYFDLLYNPLLFLITFGLNFINILCTAFTLADPKSVRRCWWLNAFTLLGSKSVRAERAYNVGEIDTWWCCPIPAYPEFHKLFKWPLAWQVKDKISIIWMRKNKSCWEKSKQRIRKQIRE